MISVVSTVFNDKNGLERFFASLQRQTRAPDEVVIVDAGSTDGSWEVLESASAAPHLSFPVQVIREPRCNVARGRNLAIETASGPLIASTDIGCDWEPRWLEDLVQPLLDNPSVQVVVGSWAVRPESLRGPWALTEWALKGDQKLVADAASYSSSRTIAYRKTAWEALGRYPEDLTLAADDAVFHLLMEQARVARIGAPSINCYWHRHASLQAYLKEQYRYGLGDGEAGIRRRDVGLTGGRLLLECGGLVLGMAFLASPLAWLKATGGAALALALASFAVRFRSLNKPTGRLRDAGVSHPRLRLLLFVYATKIWWLRGFFRGIRRGSRNCRQCRQRLREMNADTFQARLTAVSQN